MRFSSNEGDTRQRSLSPSAIPSWPLRSVTLNPQLNLGVSYPPRHHFIKEETSTERLTDMPKVTQLEASGTEPNPGGATSGSPCV